VERDSENCIYIYIYIYIYKLNLHSVSPRANKTDREIAACRRSYCQRLWKDGVAWSVQLIPTTAFLYL
jgi:hypothetical protein